MGSLLNKLRAAHGEETKSDCIGSAGERLLEQFAASGVGFAVSPGGQLDHVHRAAVAKLAQCVQETADGSIVLQEGGVYNGAWLESTGTISAEVLSRFCPAVSKATIEQFAAQRREDGLLPYKITVDGPVFKQIQLVSPPARSAWNHYLLNGRDRRFLAGMYEALAQYDDWLMRNRNTRGTGCIEAFCAYDTGHDLSPRFWHVPDTPYRDDPARYDPGSPKLPLLAPDLTASVICSRIYLSRMASELREEELAEEWLYKSDEMTLALLRHCFDEKDGLFYDVDSAGGYNRIQSDALLRVLACEIGDDEFFASALSGYLLNSRKFFSKYPFVSIAMDDPRFDPFAAYNTWAGAVNFLSLLRAPHAFEKHGRLVELVWVMQPIVSAMSRMSRFAQCLSPWTGEEGYTEAYSPAMLCVLDYIERLCGIMPLPGEGLAFNGLLPQTLDHGKKLADETVYSRIADGRRYELHNTEEVCTIWREGELLCRFPTGIRAVLDGNGQLRRLIGMSYRPVEGTLYYGGRDMPVRIAGNEAWRVDGHTFVVESSPGVVTPS